MIKCSQCLALKDKSEFYKGQGRKCKKCICKNSRKWKEENKDRKKATDAAYYKKNKDSFKAYNLWFNKQNPNYKSQYAKDNKERISSYMKEYMDNAKDEITDYYVRSLYRKNSAQDLHESLIPLKREILRLKREIKNKEK